MKTIDDRLEAASADVRDRATQVPARGAGSVVRHNRTVRVGQLAAAGVVLLAVVVATAVLFTRGEPVASTDGGIPPLTVDVARLDNNLSLAYADDEVAVPPTGEYDPPQLRSYGTPSAGPADPRLWVVTYPTGSDFLRAGVTDPGWEPITAPSGHAYINTEGPSTTVMWDPNDDSDGPALRIQGFGVDADTIRSVLEGMEPQQSGWVPRALPDGYVQLYSGIDGLEPGERMVALLWAGTAGDATGGEVTLWMYEGAADTILERNLYGFMPYAPGGEASVTATEVRGHAAIRFDVPDGIVFQWMETPTVFARLLIQGPVDPQQTLNALVEIDQATWNERIDSWGPQPTPSDPTATTVAPTTTSLG